MSRLLDSLRKLLRLKEYTIEQLRQQIAIIHEQIEARNQAIESNIRYISTERLIASVNVSGSETLEAFVNQKKFQNQKYLQEIAELKGLLSEIEDQLLSVYQEQKQYEKVQEAELLRVNTELKRKEIQILDEVATRSYSSNLTKI